MGTGLWWSHLEPLSLEVCLNGLRVIEQSFSGFCLILSKRHNREISFLNKLLLWYLQGLRADAKNSSIWIVLHIRSLVRALPSTLMSAMLFSAGHSLYNGRVSHSRQPHFFFKVGHSTYLWGVRTFLEWSVDLPSLAHSQWLESIYLFYGTYKACCEPSPAQLLHLLPSTPHLGTSNP